MGLSGRPYMRDDGGGESPVYRGTTFGGLPRPGAVVKALLIINFAVFLVQLFADRPGPRFLPGAMSAWLGVTVRQWWQVWRYLTCQFLHGDVWHIALNMLGLYLLGAPLERLWGARRFLVFYLSCGAAAGVAYAGMGAAFHLAPDRPIIGASGGVYGVVLACAVFFPHFRLILVFFPVPIRLACIIIFGGMALFVAQALSAGQAGAAASDIAHLGGAVAGAAWIWLLPGLLNRLGGAEFGGARRRSGRGRWERKLARRRKRQEQVDRILDKIHRRGLDSLSWWEKRTLRKASREQAEEDRAATGGRGPWPMR